MEDFQPVTPAIAASRGGDEAPRWTTSNRPYPARDMPNSQVEDTVASQLLPEQINPAPPPLPAPPRANPAWRFPGKPLAVGPLPALPGLDAAGRRRAE